MVSREQMQVLDLCTLRMSYEWNKLHQYNALLEQQPHIGSYLSVFIKLADPVHDYYYPEFLKPYAIKVHITMGRMCTRKMNVIPFYPTRALNDYPKLRASNELRFFKSGSTLIPFKGPMMEFTQQPIRYSKRFKGAIYENVTYLKWGLDHLTRDTTSTTTQLGLGFTVDIEPYVNPHTGVEATRFLNDEQVCSVYHKGFNEHTHECVSSGWQTATTYIGISYLWELLEYGADFESINTPRLDYRIDSETEKRCIDHFQKMFRSVNPCAKPFNICDDATQQWKLTSTDCVWYLDGDDETKLGHTYYGTECNFHNEPPPPPSSGSDKGATTATTTKTAPIPPNMMLDRYGFPLTDQMWLELLDRYAHITKKLEPHKEELIFDKVKNILASIGVDVGLETGRFLTGKWFATRVNNIAAFVRQALPEMSTMVGTRLTNALALNTISIDMIEMELRSLVASINAALGAITIFLVVVNVVDMILNATDPAGIYKRYTQHTLDTLADRSSETFIKVFSNRNVRVEMNYLAHCFGLSSITTQINIALTIHSLQPQGKCFRYGRSALYLLALPCLMQLMNATNASSSSTLERKHGETSTRWSRQPMFKDAWLKFY